MTIKRFSLFFSIMFLCLNIIYADTSLKNDFIKKMEEIIPSRNLNEYNTLKLSLKECLQFATTGNGKLHISKEEYKLAIINFKNSRYELLPKVSAKYEEIDGTTTGEDFRGESSKLELKYPIYTSFKTSNAYKQARLNIQIARLKHDKNFKDLLTETEKAYYILAEAKQRTKTLASLTAICQEAKETVKKRFDQDLARDIDWLETKILAKEVEQKEKQAFNDSALAEISLRQLFNCYTGKLEIEEVTGYKTINIDPDELITFAFSSRSDILMNNLLKEVTKLNKKIAAADSKLQISFDSYAGKRAENFKSENLDFDNEYYIGFSGKLPLGVNSIETEFIDQDTVPSAGQTTSTEFQSWSASLHFFDNKANSSKLEGVIKYYKAIEDDEKIKKTAIFEIAKTIFEVDKSYKTLVLNNEKLDLVRKKLDFKKLKLSKNEISINEYLKEAISLSDSETNYSKSLISYYTKVSELNKAIGIPGYFNPIDGFKGRDFFKSVFESNRLPKKKKWFFSRKKQNDPYYPDQAYSEIKNLPEL